jgi:hypothetical protein
MTGSMIQMNTSSNSETADKVILWITSGVSMCVYIGVLAFAFHNIFRYLRKQNNLTLMFFYISVIFVCCARCVCLYTIIIALI